jgi:predicted aldo/keto reductase-like oxidoreductase
MEYRTLGKSKKKVSVLGFGTMRLPTLGSEAQINEEQAIRMIRYAVDRGVNYIDSAYTYHGENSETLVGRAMADGYRQKVHLATKMPVWLVQKKDDFDRLFDNQLKRMQTDRIDFYLLHCLQKEPWRKMKQLGAIKWAEKVQSDGRIGELGFSFHDAYDVFTEIVDHYDWSFCQIQYNLVNEDVQAGTKGLRYAARKGLGVVIMEPLFGGTLANPPPPIRKIWDHAGMGCTPVEMAMRWLWDKPEIAVVLSGMSSMEQTIQNVESANASRKTWLDEKERAIIPAIQEAYRRLYPVPCTKCRYCMPCPSGVDIPLNFELYNNSAVFEGNVRKLCGILYNSLLAGQKAADCKKCGKCEEKCPQQIKISRMLEDVNNRFAQG